MTFLDKIKTGIFWKKTLTISLLFFSAIIIVSLLFNSFSDIINLNMEVIKATNFSDGKWRRFFIPKAVISILYGMWVTHRNTK